MIISISAEIRKTRRRRNPANYKIVIFNARKSFLYRGIPHTYTILIQYFTVRYQPKTSYANFGTRYNKLSFDQLKSNARPRPNRVEIHADTHTRGRLL